MKDKALLYGMSDQAITWLSTHVGLHNQVVAHWQALCESAKDSGFDLAIASGYRSFERQLTIWNRKVSGELAIKDLNNHNVDTSLLDEAALIEAILTFSALPGTSRHHWGTDLDFYSPSLLTTEQTLQLEPWEYQQGGPFYQLTLWLQENCQRFGFYFPYDQYRGGIAAEPWHLSYFPLAEKYQQQYQQTELRQYLLQSKLSAKQTVIQHLDNILSRYVFNIGTTPHE
ncbi:M15 family metallopeptidase [Thalassotalea sp. G2M2-11]|uniref:M15 family metallopeptidase n=1 Tax=Thalassotalea sp. G2M2-11 TaxID=2787627 RepID=UPI0019D04FF8|nr:M15 family metallopeptidase [Thalassotalea sp. G2M2-11]